MKPPHSGPASDAAASQRLDQWLCNARFAKSRTLAQAVIARGKVRINRERVEKQSQSVRVGDVLTLSLGPRVRVIEIKGFSVRRGPATEAQTLYVELTPEPVQPKAAANDGARTEAGAAALNPAQRTPGSGRPTKRDRRVTDRFKSGPDEA